MGAVEWRILRRFQSARNRFDDICVIVHDWALSGGGKSALALSRCVTAVSHPEEIGVRRGALTPEKEAVSHRGHEGHQVLSFVSVVTSV